MLIRLSLVLLLLFAPVASAQDLDAALSALVKISGTRNETPVRGSGFVIGLDGDKATIVTASHVIEGAREIEVTFAVDRTQSFPAGAVLGMETGNPRGLAVFQVRGALPAGLAPLSFETETPLQRGENVFLFGFPEMAAAPLSLQMFFAGLDGNFLRLDRPAGEGLSGAPVLRNGKVVGVVMDEDLRLTYAVKATVAHDAVTGWGVVLGGQSSPRVATNTETRPVPRAVETCEPRKEPDENGIVFVRICPGTFTMGSAENDPQADHIEKPAHLVTLSEFLISETEITRKQYYGFRLTDQGDAAVDLPVTDVSWEEAAEVCKHLGGRLPTEAEWEYSARAGSQSAWTFGSDERLLADYAWYDKNAGNEPHPVAQRKPNAWGLYDMHGNVWEWVADWYATYPAAAQPDPPGPGKGELRVLRGGSYATPPGNLRSAYRGRVQPMIRDAFVGFRCARSPRRQ